MVFVKIPMKERNLNSAIKNMQSWNIALEDKKDLLLFLKELSLGKVNLGNKISESRQLKYLVILRISLEYFRKPISKIALADMESLDLDLSKNKLKRMDGKPFAEETKIEVKRFLKIYLKWKLKSDPARFAELASWMDTKIRKKKTPEFLSESEALKLYRAQLPLSEVAGLPLCLIVLDDSWEVVDASLDRDGISPIGSLFLLARQMRVSFLVASQVPERLSSAVFSAHGVTVAFRLPSEGGRRKIAEVM